MKMPRDISGEELVKLLSKYGYHVTRQTGSHIRLTTGKNGEHHITIPKNKPLKIGTLSNILNDVSKHLNISKEKILND
ncbi:MAG: type II toxin-antitoxin system HicA family toxin [Dissulfuribacterales bacterium]